MPTTLGDVRTRVKRTAISRAIVLAWRRLTEGKLGATGGDAELRGGAVGGTKGLGRTLVACSGGADSVALVLALACSRANIVVGHVVHDLRTKKESRADRDFVRALADGLGVEFVEASIRVRVRGGSGKWAGQGTARGLESKARAARYAALLRLARERGCRFVATGHHADDQLETVLMALIRGAGLRGLGGIAPKRVLARERGGGGGEGRDRVWLIRPMLEATRPITHEEACELCRCAGVVWREDHTNAEGGTIRNAIRLSVVPALRRLESSGEKGGVGSAHAGGLAIRVARNAQTMREADRLVRSLAAVIVRAGVRTPERALADGEATSEVAGLMWTRRSLRSEPAIVLSAVLRASYVRLSGRAGLDRVVGAALRPIVRAIRDGSTEPRRFSLGSEARGGVVVWVRGREVTVQHARAS